MWRTFADVDVSLHIFWMVKKLYENVRVNGQKTEASRIEKGVRQGCVVSPLIFNAVGERIVREIEQKPP